MTAARLRFLTAFYTSPKKLFDQSKVDQIFYNLTLLEKCNPLGDSLAGALSLHARSKPKCASFLLLREKIQRTALLTPLFTDSHFHAGGQYGHRLAG